MEEEQKKIPSPRQCIGDYCYLHCDKKEVLNSRRAVAECFHKDCPLHPYRTGRIMFRDPEFGAKREKTRRAERLEEAREKVRRSESILRYAEMDTERQGKYYKSLKARLEEKRQNVEQAKEYVKTLEQAFFKEDDPNQLWR